MSLPDVIEPRPENLAKVETARRMGAPIPRTKIPFGGAPGQSQVSSSATPFLRAVSVPDLIRMDVADREMILHPFLPQQGLAMIYSARGERRLFRWVFR